MRRLLMVLLAMLLAMGVAACGEDSVKDEGTSDDAAQSDDIGDSKDAPDVSAGGGGDDAMAEGTGTELLLDVAPGTLEFMQTRLKAPAGKVTMLLTNPDATKHDIALEDADGKLIEKGELVADGGVSTVTAELEAGTYTYYCTPHKAAGMTGTLVVT